MVKVVWQKGRNAAVFARLRQCACQ